MAHDIFLSYASRDRPAADALCRALEAQGVVCWIAPRDVPPGQPYGAALVAAIRASRAMVLLFSTHSNASPHVLNEIERAVSLSIAILPVRLDNVVPSSEMEYFLSRPHWLDAMPPPLDSHVGRIAGAVQGLLARPGHPAAAPSGEKPATVSTYEARVREECARVFGSDLVRPDRVYVPQHAISPAGDEAALADVAERFWTGSASRVAVIGNYGMGKSYFTWRATLDQLDRVQGRREQALPILFPLKRFNFSEATEIAGHGRDIVQQLLDHAIGFDFPRVDRRQFVRWLEDGVVGVILDALDELTLPRSATWQEAVAPLLAIDGARVMVTSRGSYVRDAARDLAKFEAYELVAWGDREWRTYLAAAGATLDRVGGPDAFAAAVASKPTLGSLTTRPLWCFMIVEIADEIAQVDDVALSGLYQRFLDRAVKRRPLSDQVLTLGNLYCAMERFAETCARDHRSTMDEELLLSLLSRLFESVGHRKLQTLLTEEVRRYAFLNCDRQRRYGFGHQSFEDYFVAAAAARWVVEQATGESTAPAQILERQPLLAEQRLTDDQALFLAGILQDAGVMRSLELSEDGGARLQARVVRFLERELREDDGTPVRRANLFRAYLELLRGQEAPRRPEIEGLCLRGANLAGVDLSGCTFENLDLTEAMLTRARLARSSFPRCIFFGAALDGADFTGADFALADLTGIEVGADPPTLTGAVGLERATLGTRERRLLSLES